MMQWKLELSKLMDEQVAIILHILGAKEFDNWSSMQIKKQILRFGFCEVYDSAQIASVQYPRFNKRLNALGGICYNRSNKKTR